MNRLQRAGVVLLAVSAFLFGLTWGTSVNHAVAPVAIQDLGLTQEAARATQEAVAAMESLQVVGADSDEDNRAKRVSLDPALRAANGGEWPWHGPQETGDCNAFATCRAVEHELSGQIQDGKDYVFKLADRPWAYYGGRVRNGRVQLSGQGSVPAWSAEWFRDKGVLWAEFAPPYSGSRSSQWGSKGPPQTAFDQASPYRIESFAQCRNSQDVCNALVAGYPVLFGSMKFGTTSIKLVEGRNVATDNTAWPHAQVFVAYDGTTKTYGKAGLFRVMNSWGPNAHKPNSTLTDDAPGGYYVTAKIVDMICDEGMAFSISGATGFPKRDLNFDVLVGAVGMEPPNKEDTMQFEMDPMLGYGAAAVTLTLAVVLLVLGRTLGNGMWRRGVAASGIALMLLVPPAKSQDIDFGAISRQTVATATPDKVDGLNFAVLTDDVQHAVAVAVEDSPLKFDFCDCLDDCDCKDGCSCRNTKQPAKAEKTVTVQKIDLDEQDTPPAAPEPRFRAGEYVSGGHRQTWRINGVSQTPEVYREHILRDHRAAAYGITADWLRTLNLAALINLHSDLHEGTVANQRAAKPAAKSPTVSGKGRWVTTQVCSQGRCRSMQVWVPESN